jgi:hypothetical protein
MNKDRESTGHAEKLYILYVHDECVTEVIHKDR